MSHEFNFKQFTKVGSKLGNYSISFNGKSYSFGFNSGFYTKEGINKYKKVALFFDETKKAVAFHFSSDENVKGVFTIVHSHNGTTGSVTAKSFIIENKLVQQEYFGKRVPKKVEDDNFGELFVIELLENQQQKN